MAVRKTMVQKGNEDGREEEEEVVGVERMQKEKLSVIVEKEFCTKREFVGKLAFNQGDNKVEVEMIQILNLWVSFFIMQKISLGHSSK